MVKAATKKTAPKKAAAKPKPASRKPTKRTAPPKATAPAPASAEPPAVVMPGASTSIMVTGSIPMPTRRQPTTPAKYPFNTMPVGGMFFMPGKSSDNFATYASLQTRKLAPKKFKTRTMFMVECPEGTEHSVQVEIETGKVIWMTPCDASTPGAVKGVGVWRQE